MCVPVPNPVGYVDNPYSGCAPHDRMPKYTKKEKAQKARGESPGICPDRTVPAVPAVPAKPIVPTETGGFHPSPQG
ncbi:hypothetical protein SAMN05428945_6493 [Streptomyces sp. 2224.1]|nr:hypothetical protein SAMN05428945_6493 [Streptomyces sp. 2224.1]